MVTPVSSLEQRFTAGAPVRLHLADRDAAYAGEVVDVSTTGMRVIAHDLPDDTAQALAGAGGHSKVDVEITMPDGRSAKITGRCRWIRNRGRGRFAMGIEYLPTQISEGAAIARQFEQAYVRPQVTRAVILVAGVVAVIGVLALWASSRRYTKEMAQAKQELAAAIADKQMLASRLDALQDPTLDVIGEPDRIEELEKMRAELRAARSRVAEKSIALVDIQESQSLSERGDEFLADGNLGAAKLAYELAVESGSSNPESHLKLALVYEFYGDGDAALDAYAHYLEMRPHAVDRYEIDQRVTQLLAQSAPEVEVDPAADFPALEELRAGHAKLERKDIAGAVKHYRGFVDRHGSYPDGHYWLGVGYALQGNDNAACGAMKRYTELAPQGAWARQARVNLQGCD